MLFLKNQDLFTVKDDLRYVYKLEEYVCCIYGRGSMSYNKILYYVLQTFFSSRDTRTIQKWLQEGKT